MRGVIRRLVGRRVTWAAKGNAKWKEKMVDCKATRGLYVLKMKQHLDDYMYLEDKGMEGKWRTTRREDLVGACGPRHSEAAWLRLRLQGHYRAACRVKRSWMRPLLYAGAYVLIGWLARARKSLRPPVGNFNRLDRSFRASANDRSRRCRYTR